MRKSLGATSVAIATLIFTFASRVPANSDTAKTISGEDAAAIRTVLERYRTGWLAGDAAKVCGTLTQDAVLLPHHGVPPVVGMAAIGEFWFPAGPTKTTITRLERTVDEIGGDGTLAYVRGRSEVAWTVEDGGARQHWRNAGNYLAILKRQGDGKWLMSHLIWDDPPNEQLD